MKASDLKQMIREIVAEEVKRQLPLVLSEMYVRKIVSESAAPLEQQSAPRLGRSLLETLPYAEDSQPIPQKQRSREQLRETIRKHVLADPEHNPLAELYEGTVPIADAAEDGGSEGIPLERMPGLGNFSKFVEAPKKKVPVQEQTSSSDYADWNMKRIERERARLDGMKVG